MTVDRPASPTVAGPPPLEMRGITKRYPGVVANDGIDLVVRAGEIHALLGENGAGKTTLMNVLYGLAVPDAGEILLDGEPVTIRSPHDAIGRGISMVHQHFMLVPVLSVAENILLGEEPIKRKIFLDRSGARERIRELGSRFGWEIDPDRKVGQLSVGWQQRVEILKALYRNAKVLILDEPTAVLTPQETREIFDVLRRLRDEGYAIVFISHKLYEVLEVADRITVIRRGKVVGERAPAETNEDDLAELMVGREVQLSVDRGMSHPRDPILTVDDLHVKDDRGREAVHGLEPQPLLRARSVERDLDRAAAPLPGALAVPLVRQEMRHRREQEGPEAPRFGAKVAQVFFLEEAGEVRLRQVLGVGRRHPATADERVDRRPVGLADLGERCAGGLHVAFVQAVFDLLERVVEPIFGGLGHGAGSIVRGRGGAHAGAPSAMFRCGCPTSQAG